MTPADVRHATARAVASKRAPSQDFIRGAWAACNAICGLIFGEKPGWPYDADHPVPGMRVRCASRPCTMTCVRFKPGRLDGELILLVLTEPDGRPFDSSFRDHDRRRRHMRISTWRRWAAGGDLLEGEHLPVAVSLRRVLSEMAAGTEDVESADNPLSDPHPPERL